MAHTLRKRTGEDRPRCCRSQSPPARIAWLFMFFLLGNQALISAGKRKAQEEEAANATCARRSVDNDVDIERTVQSNGPPVDDPRFENDASVNEKSDDPPGFSNSHLGLYLSYHNRRRR